MQSLISGSGDIKRLRTDRTDGQTDGRANGQADRRTGRQRNDRSKGEQKSSLEFLAQMNQVM